MCHFVWSTMWTPTIALLFMCSHCFVRSLESNVIGSSKEAMDPLEQVDPHSGTVYVQNNVNTRRRADTYSPRHHRPAFPDQEHNPSTRNTCNGSQKKNQSKEIEALDDDDNSRKVAEKATCVRSRDCEVGLCCVRYLKGKRCQPIPKEGDTCLLRGGRSKQRRNLDRCNCAPGLICRAHAESPKNQGVCQPKLRENRRSARHSGKRRMAERRCG
ncbi:dickkopf-related protein 4-like isoform X2 [Oncorhynchus keta]|uniref:dickkopf-related protein 4-like isoform X2 n=2 Tax=Oncorhynchus keta TaxID=8018 RepID=UPI0015FA8076|nr:dickkopf-related protein 4-like isoform X2 [Oncorhynchus keta]